jgi:hypothetical protein
MAFTGVWTVQQWSSLVSMLFVLISSIRLLRLARCLGVTVNNEGLRLVGGTFLNPAGFWPWDEIDSVAVVEEEYLRNAPRQVLLLTRAHGAIRLGRCQDVRRWWRRSNPTSGWRTHLRMRQNSLIGQGLYRDRRHEVRSPGAG